jgi:hypothetical protein
MVLQETPNNTKKKNKGLASGRYARSEEELYKKAVGLLDKCKIAARVRAT